MALELDQLIFEGKVEGILVHGIRAWLYEAKTVSLSSGAFFKIIFYSHSACTHHNNTVCHHGESMVHVVRTSCTVANAKTERQLLCVPPCQRAQG